MAQVNADLVPDVSPTPAPPDDYVRVQATPASFGGLIAQGLDKFGAGAITAGKYFSQIQVDDASNAYQKQASEALEKVRMLNGQDALNAQPGFKQQLGDLWASTRKGLSTDEQRVQFDNANRPFTDRFIMGTANTHFIEQGQRFGLQTANDAVNVASGMAATAGSDGNLPAVEVARAKAYDANIKTLQLNGMENDPDAVAKAGQAANLTAYKSAGEAMLLKHPEAAQTFIESKKTQLGAEYEPLAARARDAVAKSYASQADAILAKDPAAAQAFVEKNREKFGESYGAALLRTKEAGEDAAASDLNKRAAADAAKNAQTQPAAAPASPQSTPAAVQPASAPGAAPAAPQPAEHPTATSRGVVFGDSLGVGVKQAYGMDGDAVVGRNPRQVLGAINADKTDLTGRNVVLSTGASNNVADVGLVKDQIAALKARNPASITVLGVGDRPDVIGANTAIQKIATDDGVKFQPVDPGRLSADRIHPSDYHGLLGDAHPAAAPRQSQNSTTAAPPDSAAMLRGFEGFREQAYWDTDHYRVGYGSDTVTRADGSVVPVTANTTISRDDAERDLTRRIGDTQRGIQQSIGADTWTKLSPGAQAALTSVAYNYGHLPGSVAQAAQSGDAQRLAQAIASLPSNPDRRQQEAAVVRGGALPQGFGGNVRSFAFSGQPPATSSGLPAPGGASIAAPAASISPPEPNVTATPETPVEDAGFHPNEPINPAPAPVDPVDAANSAYAQRLQFIAASDASEAVKKKAAAKAEYDLRYAMAEAQQNAAAIHERQEAISNDVLGTQRKGDTTGAYRKLEDAVNSKKIDEKTYDALSDTLFKRTGDPNPKWNGPGYSDALNRILLPGADPQHIGNTRQLLELEAQGRITARGFSDLQRAMGDLTKSEDEVGLQTVRAEGLKALEQRLSAGVDPLGKVRNEKGLEVYRTVGVAQYNRAFNEWRQSVREGKGDDFFPLSDPKKLDAFAESIYPKRQRDADLLLDQQDVDENAAPSLPPAPAHVDSQAWSRVVQTPPSFGGKPLAPNQWANVLSILADNPTSATIGAFDRRFAPAGLSGAAVLHALRGAQVGRPENVGAPVATPIQPEPLLPVFGGT